MGLQHYTWDMSRIPLKYHTNVLFYTKYTHPALICRGTEGRTDGHTDGRTENIYSIFRDKLLLLGEHVYTWKMTWKSQTHSAFGIFLNLEKFPGISTLFLKLAEDDNLTGLQTITKKAFHMLIPKRTTKHCSTICYPKISSLGIVFISCSNVEKFWTYSVFSAHRLTTWMDYKPSSSFEHIVCERQYLARE